MRTAVIVDAIRTPSGRGKPGGALSDVHPVDLLAQTIRSLVERTGIDPGIVDDVYAGCVTQAGQQAQNIARNAALAAGLPEHVPGTTIDRQCGSSQQATTFAASTVVAGVADVVIACGVESMSRAPMGSNLGGQDPFGSGLRARYPEGLVGQGVSAELIAARWNLSRDELDAFAARSHERAAATWASGGFDREVVAVALPDGTLVTSDETVRAGTSVEGLSGLPAVFQNDALAARYPEIAWRITPGNASPLTDGASAALIMSEERALTLGLTPRARFVSFAAVGSDPIEMLTGILPATRRILERSGLGIDDIDAFEVNEAFASVPLAWQREFGVDDARLNPRGGAIALGHPLGASGTKLLATLLGQLEATGGRYGLQTMCEGGGMANATIIERL
ncbi:thiolase family protein [Plantibacter flavus]|uniref:thiolase family protein n=1 Tax=Plantibacter flavus TaxID=150123 RepID=UPI003F18CEDF